MAQLQKLMKSARKPQRVVFFFSLFLNPDAYFSAFKLFVPFIPFYNFFVRLEAECAYFASTLFPALQHHLSIMWVHSELFLNSPFFYIHLFSFLLNKIPFYDSKTRQKARARSEFVFANRPSVLFAIRRFQTDIQRRPIPDRRLVVKLLSLLFQNTLKKCDIV